MPTCMPAAACTRDSSCPHGCPRRCTPSFPSCTHKCFFASWTAAAQAQPAGRRAVARCMLPGCRTMAEGELRAAMLSQQPSQQMVRRCNPALHPPARTAECAPNPWLVVLPPRAVHRRHVHILPHHILGALMEGKGSSTAKSWSAGWQGCACPLEEAESRAWWHPAPQPCAQHTTYAVVAHAPALRCKSIPSNPAQHPPRWSG